MTHTQQFVKLGYGDLFDKQTRSLNFTTEPLPANEAAELARMVKGYNEYNGELVAHTILEVADVWKSDFQQVTFSFGRESSPVLYIHCPYWKSQTERFENREKLIALTKTILSAANADEITDSISGVRAW
jgi:hypothetical protein